MNQGMRPSAAKAVVEMPLEDQEHTYEVEYTIREPGIAVVKATNRDEARRKFWAGEDEDRWGTGEAHVSGIRSVVRVED